MLGQVMNLSHVGISISACRSRMLDWTNIIQELNIIMQMPILTPSSLPVKLRLDLQFNRGRP